MDITELQSSIDEALADSAHRVMMTALDAIGPCTYATHLSPYVRMRVALAHLDRWWWDYEHRLPEAAIVARFNEIHTVRLRVTSEIGYPASLGTYEVYRGVD